MILEFNVKHQNLKWASKNNVPVENSQNYLEAKFNFVTSEWTADTNKIFAYFTHVSEDLGTYEVTVDSNGNCLVPISVIKKSGFNVSLIARDTDYSIVITTNVETVKVIEGGPSDSTATDVEANAESPAINLDKFEEHTGELTSDDKLYLYNTETKKGSTLSVLNLVTTQTSKSLDLTNYATYDNKSDKITLLYLYDPINKIGLQSTVKTVVGNRIKTSTELEEADTGDYLILKQEEK